MRQTFGRYWCGDCPLWRVYWRYGVAFGGVVETSVALAWTVCAIALAANLLRVIAVS